MTALTDVRGKGNKDRRLPVQQALIDVSERSLDSAWQGSLVAPDANAVLAGWPPGQPPSRCSLVATVSGSPAARCSIRVLRAFKKAGHANAIAANHRETPDSSACSAQ
jgi:hypothetical protein